MLAEDEEGDGALNNMFVDDLPYPFDSAADLLALGGRHDKVSLIWYGPMNATVDAGPTAAMDWVNLYALAVNEENAAEIGMEYNLGMTCYPVGACAGAVYRTHRDGRGDRHQRRHPGPERRRHPFRVT